MDLRLLGMGVFWVVDRGDKVGMTTQVWSLEEKGRKLEVWKFTERTTEIGSLLDKYL